MRIHLFRVSLSVACRLIAAVGASVASADACAQALRTWGSIGGVNADQLANVVDVSSAGAHILVRYSDGSVGCWGSNSTGQCDVPPSLGPAQSIAGGRDHSIAVRTNGTVVCWGDNTFAQCSVPGNLGPVSVAAAGRHHSIALLADGTVRCWGAGQVVGTGANFGQSIVPAGLNGVVAVAGGAFHTIALRSDGSLRCWGRNTEGQCNIPAGLGSITMVAGGDYHTMALRPDGTVACWGFNEWGAINVPVGLDSVVKIEGGAYHSVALRSTGEVVCWGWNNSGQCDVPPDLGSVIAIASGEYQVTALRSNGTVRSWGSNSHGQSNMPTALPGPSRIATGAGHFLALDGAGVVTAWGGNVAGESAVPTDLGTAVEISAGYVHSVARTASGAVTCWGSNDFGQSTVPAGLASVESVSAGWYHTIAIEQGGSVRCWGRNDGGQCNTPSDLGPALAVAGGYQFSMAIRSDRSVRGWGRNQVGQLNVPTGLANVVTISCGDYHTAALNSSGVVTCWGNGTAAQSVVPADLGTATAVVAGHYHTVALKSDGTVRGWGWRDGSAAVPFTVPAGLVGVQQLAAGGSTVALIDGCPADPYKTAPGTCGCGVSDADSDGDRVADCNDGCPNDPAKTAPGVCGCGVSDADSDADGTADCNDGCPSDPYKIAPGACGCGVSDADSDGDGTADCIDGCPNDPAKIAPGTCGCGVSDADSDGDGVADCNDGCPNDPAKTAPGICGCGASDADSDGDGVADCNDGCPNDPAKTAPGVCGCGVTDTDSDSDGTADCNDGCPNDPAKTAPGICGCGVSDADSDGDGVANCNDGCPNDPAKTAAGICGCGTAEVDANSNGVYDCLENCDDSFDLFAVSPQDGARFGKASALDGDWLALGAPDEDVGGFANAGAVYVYQRVAGLWTAWTRLTAPTPAANARFGSALAWRAASLAVGAPGEFTGEGQVYDFARASDGSFGAGVGLEANGPTVETVEFTTDFTGPFDSTHPVSFKLFNLPPAASDVTVYIDHAADMGAANETYTLNLLNYTTGALRSGTDCSLSTDQATVPASVFNASALTGRWVFLLSPNANVDPCVNSTARIRLSYSTPRAEAQSAVIAPFDDTHPAVATFTGVRANVGDVFIQVVRRGDINATNETYQIYLDGVAIGSAVLNPEIGGPECVTITDTRVASAVQFAAALSDGSVTVSAVSLGGIDPCAFSEAQIVVRYISQHDREVGAALSSDGAVLLAGAPGSQVGAAASAGAVLKYAAVGAGLSRVGRFVASPPIAGERVGASIDEFGGVIVAGAPNSIAGPGSVRVFSASGVVLQTLAAPTGAFGFGSSVALASGALAVGAPLEGEGGFTGAGAVHIYGLTGVGLWGPSQRIGCPQPGIGRGFGAAVSVAESTLVIGAPSGTGATYFARPSGEGAFGVPTLRDSCRVAFDGALGASIATDGRSVLVGAPESQSGRGRARMYLLPPPCIGDVFPDGRIDGADLAIFLSRWGPADATGFCDFDGDGEVRGVDLSIMLSGWGACP